MDGVTVGAERGQSIVPIHTPSSCRGISAPPTAISPSTTPPSGAARSGSRPSVSRRFLQHSEANSDPSAKRCGLSPRVRGQSLTVASQRITLAIRTADIQCSTEATPNSAGCMVPNYRPPYFRNLNPWFPSIRNASAAPPADAVCTSTRGANQMAKTSLSFHACRRAQQRGVPTHLVEAILTHHDAEHMAGSGCRVLRVSRQALSGGAPSDVSRRTADA